MATRNSSDSSHDERPYADLPFVFDCADPARPGGTRREHWHVPDEADFETACNDGARWAAQFLEYQRAHGDAINLGWLARAIAAREATLRPDSGARGYAVGFFGTIGKLAQAGAAACGSAYAFVDAQQVRRLQAARQAGIERRARAAAARLVNRAARLGNATGRQP